MMKTRHLILIGAMTAVSCSENDSLVLLQATVHDDRGRPIGSAEIHIEGQAIGSSDDLGLIQATLTLKRSANYDLVIQKSSSDSYYSTHRQKILAPSEPSMTLKIGATLYAVPKSRNQSSSEPPEQSREEATIVQTEAQPSPPQDLPKPSENQAKTAIDLGDTSKRIDPMPAEDPEPVSPQIQERAIMTFHASDRSSDLPDTKIFMGHEDSTNLVEVCATSNKGRCFAAISPGRIGRATFYARKPGYTTQKSVAIVTNKGNIQFHMKMGNCIEILALSNAYSKNRGISGVDVFIDDKLIGKTDRFGFFAIEQDPGIKGTIDLGLQARDHVPELEKISLVTGQPIYHSAYFFPGTIARPSIEFAELLQAGSSEDALSPYLGRLREDVAKSIQASSQSLSQSASLKLPQALIEEGSSAPRKADFMVTPTLVVEGRTRELMLVLSDTEGKQLAAFSEPLLRAEAADISDASNRLVKQIEASIPWEGVITEIHGDQSFSFALPEGVQPLTEKNLEIFGATGSNARTIVARAAVIAGHDGGGTGKIIDKSPRSRLAVGNQVKIRVLRNPPKEMVNTGDEILQLATDLPGVHIFAGSRWLGSTNRDGSIAIARNSLAPNERLRLTKAGYKSRYLSPDFRTLGPISVNLPLSTTRLEIDSVPPFATVRINGTVVGRTPLTHFAKAEDRRISLEILGTRPYKSLARDFDLSNPNLILSGKNALKLEYDFMGEANILLSSAQIDKATDLLKQVPSTHSDAPAASNQLGEIAINFKGDPPAALGYFRAAHANPLTRKSPLEDTITLNMALAAFKAAKAATDPLESRRYYEEGVVALNTKGAFAAAPEADLNSLQQKAIAAKEESERRLDLAQSPSLFFPQDRM